MGVQQNNREEGNAFENASATYEKDVRDHVKTDEWEKMSAMTRGEYLGDKIDPVITKPKRMDKISYYLGIAEAVAQRGTCLRRKFGAVIVKNDSIVSTGYVGAPRGRRNCCDIGKCFRMEHNIPSGTMYEKCRSVHAEMNAIIAADKEEMMGAVLYLVGIENDGSITPKADCCAMCKRMIINSGISIVVIKTPDGFKPINVSEWVTQDDSLDMKHEGY